ncbi:major facilitator superfamily-domain-containing protein [Kockiozyma suomiensis]|uniref:major facilitator superfamily-domain-containing protein n=1 Tax=Kockiozyma suomiensis TaxID=1337062 RepID=UPI0033435CF9
MNDDCVGDAKPGPEKLSGISQEDYRALPLSNIRPPVYASVSQEIIVLITLTFGAALATSNLGATQIALAHIGRSFDLEGAKLSWAISAFSLSAGSFVLLLAGVADTVGRKRMVLGSFIWYSLWCLIGGFMHSDIVFFVFRGFQGLAGASTIPAAIGILGATYAPGQRRNKIMATYGAGAPLGFVIGIVVGGICSQFLSWRAIFWFFAIEYSLFAVIVYWLVPDDPAMSWSDTKRNLARLDFIGAALSTVSLVVFVFALTQSGATSKGWGQPYVIAMIVIGVVMFAVFVFWESKATNPLMPLYIWRYPGFALCMLIVACGYMNFLGVLNYYITLFFQNVRGASAILTTAYLIPQAVAGIIVNFICALTLHIIPGWILMTLALLAFFAASLLWALQPMHMDYWPMAFPAICLSVVGADIAFNVANLHTVSAVPPKMQSTAAGIFNTVMQLAAAVGVAASATAVEAAYKYSDHTGAEQTYDSYKAAFWFGCGVSGVGIICSPFMNVGVAGRKQFDKPDDADSVGAELAQPDEENQIEK